MERHKQKLHRKGLETQIQLNTTKATKERQETQIQLTQQKLHRKG